jgi:hypothetical protein
MAAPDLLHKAGGVQAELSSSLVITRMLNGIRQTWWDTVVAKHALS